ncbi:MAG: FixH family protein [Saprospiraceae bacterium]
MRSSKLVQAKRFFLLFSIVAILAGCTSEFEGQTADGRYKVSIMPVPEPIPFNALFALNLKVDKTDGGTLQAGTQILVDASMPAHKHGMNTVPIVQPGDAPGSYVVQGMLFHMTGRWEIAVKIQEGDSTSVAKLKVWL